MPIQAVISRTLTVRQLTDYFYGRLVMIIDRIITIIACVATVICMIMAILSYLK